MAVSSPAIDVRHASTRRNRWRFIGTSVAAELFRVPFRQAVLQFPLPHKWARPKGHDMKSNTLAIALASMLVGGVAVGAFHNSRDDRSAGADGALAAADEAGKLEYAKVIDVVPVTEKQ